MEFGAQFRVRVAQVLAHAHHGLIERQARFHADHGQIESIGKAEANAALPFLQLLLQQESRKKKAERGHAHEQQGRIESGKQKNREEPKRGEQDAQTAIDGNVLGAAISRLNQPEPGFRNLRGRDGQGAAEGIEGLLHAFAHGGFCLGFGALPADFAEAGSEHRRRRNCGRSKGEHDHHDGKKNDNRECQSQRHKSDLVHQTWILIILRMKK